MTLKELRLDQGFVKLLAAEGIAKAPELKGEYTV
jgi:hypothetical protein